MISKSRALIYQRFFIGQFKKETGFIIPFKGSFKKAKLVNVYSEFLSDRLKEFDNKEIPKEYEKVVERNILRDSDSRKRIKYDDKTLHKSKLIRYFFYKDYPVKENQKVKLDNIFKNQKK